MDFDISPSERTVLGGLCLLALAWILVIIPFLSSQEWFFSLNPIPAYFLYNAGAIILFAVVFGFVAAHLFVGESSVLDYLRFGIAGWLGASFIYDLWQPPFFLGLDGKVLAQLNTASLANTAVDAMVAEVWKSLLGSAIVLMQLNFTVVLLAAAGLFVGYFLLRSVVAALVLVGVGAAAGLLLPIALTVSLWFVVVYLVTPLLVGFIAALLLAPRVFTSLFDRSG